VLPNDKYFEIHHVIPRCCGGSDDPSNLVNLTAKEHFVAHALLCFIFPENPKIFQAFNAMSHWGKSKNKRYCSGQKYQKLRESWIEVMRNPSEETRRRMSEAKLNQKIHPTNLMEWTKLNGPAFAGHSHSDESKDKMSKSRKGKKLSEEHKIKISKGLKSSKKFQENHKNPSSEACRNRLGSKLTQEQKDDISKFHTGRKRTEETKKRQSEARKKWWENKKKSDSEEFLTIEEEL
jgi:hypothetical protein